MGEREKDSQKGWPKAINVLEMISPFRSGRDKVQLSYLRRGKVHGRALTRFVCPLQGGCFKALVEMGNVLSEEALSRWWSRVLKEVALNLFL